VFAYVKSRLYKLAVSTPGVTLCVVSAAPKTVFAHSLIFPALPIGIETVFDWIYGLPDLGIVLLFGLVGACLLAGVPFLREKLLRIKVPSAHSEATDKALGVVTSFTGVVLAFSLVQAHGNLRNLEVQVGVEAHNLAQLDRLILRYGDPATDPIRAALHDYAKSIVRTSGRN
jgi:hypothetical protein